MTFNEQKTDLKPRKTLLMKDISLNLKHLSQYKKRTADNESAPVENTSTVVN